MIFFTFSKKHRKKKAQHKSSSESEEESSEGKGVLNVWNVRLEDNASFLQNW